jgi:ParB family chromosome partitioning protein
LKELKRIELNRIKEPERPDRITIGDEKVRELADSMKRLGLLQPIVIFPVEDGYYEIEAGHRRYLAACSLNWETIDCIVIDRETTKGHLARAHENLIRENLNILEEAKLVEALVEDQGCGVDEAARKLSKSRAWVEKRLDVLRMPETLQETLKEGKITLSVAQELWKCKDEELRHRLLEAAINYGASARTVKGWIEDHQIGPITEAYEDRQYTGTIQSMDMGDTMLRCGCCGRVFPVHVLRHMWLDPDCMAAVLELGQEVQKILKEQKNE